MPRSETRPYTKKDGTQVSGYTSNRRKNPPKGAGVQSGSDVLRAHVDRAVGLGVLSDDTAADFLRSGEDSREALLGEIEAAMDRSFEPVAPSAELERFGDLPTGENGKPVFTENDIYLWAVRERVGYAPAEPPRNDFVGTLDELVEWMPHSSLYRSADKPQVEAAITPAEALRQVQTDGRLRHDMGGGWMEFTPKAVERFDFSAMITHEGEADGEHAKFTGTISEAVAEAKRSAENDDLSVSCLIEDHDTGDRYEDWLPIRWAGEEDYQVEHLDSDGRRRVQVMVQGSFDLGLEDDEDPEGGASLWLTADHDGASYGYDTDRTSAAIEKFFGTDDPRAVTISKALNKREPEVLEHDPDDPDDDSPITAIIKHASSKPAEQRWPAAKAGLQALIAAAPRLGSSPAR